MGAVQKRHRAEVAKFRSNCLTGEEYRVAVRRSTSGGVAGFRFVPLWAQERAGGYAKEFGNAVNGV